MLIILLAGPLIVASLPVENRFQKQLVFFSNKIAKAPILTWLCGVAIMWFWHIPSIFNSMFMMNGSASGLMFLHFLSLIIAGMLFSWPIINPYKSSRLKPLASVIYLSTACVFLFVAWIDHYIFSHWHLYSLSQYYRPFWISSFNKKQMEYFCISWSTNGWFDHVGARMFYLPLCINGFVDQMVWWERRSADDWRIN